MGSPSPWETQPVWCKVDEQLMSRSKLKLHASLLPTIWLVDLPTSGCFGEMSPFPTPTASLSDDQPTLITLHRTHCSLWLLAELLTFPRETWSNFAFQILKNCQDLSPPPILLLTSSSFDFSRAQDVMVSSSFAHSFFFFFF